MGVVYLARAERISRGPLPLEDAIEIAIHIADALESAHEKGVIHRDLKPGNIMVTPDGTVKVLDLVWRERRKQLHRCRLRWMRIRQLCTYRFASIVQRCPGQCWKPQRHAKKLA